MSGIAIVGAVAAGATISAGFILSAALAWQHRTQPGVRAFMVISVLLAVVPVPLALGFVGFHTALPDVVFAGFTIASVCWLILVFEYTGRGPTMTARRVAGLGAYAGATLGGVVVAKWLSGVALEAIYASNTVLQGTMFAMLGYGILLLGRSTQRYDELRRGEAFVLAATGGGLALIHLLRVLTPQLPEQPMKLPQLVVLGVIAGVVLTGQRRYGVFEGGPGGGHLAREVVFDDLGQAVLLADREDRVVDCNRTAARTFGVDQAAVRGVPVSDVVGTHPAPTAGTTTLETAAGTRTFAVETTRVTNRRGDPIGRAYRLEDVTERRTHEQRLAVLDRVLRHNLRNDLDAVHAFAEELQRCDEAGAPDPETLAERIQTTASDLADIGETVSRTEQLLARERLDAEPVDVVGMVRQVAADRDASGSDRNRGEPGRVEIDASRDSITVRSDRPLLEAAVEEVLDNALTYSPPDTNVRIAVSEATDGIQIAVADGGPGIPERERRVLLEGEESPLRHGAGLGLWLVHWCLTRLGGDLALAENQPAGSVVTLRVPDRSPGGEFVAAGDPR